MPQVDLLPREFLTTTDWWGDLSPSEQRTVLIETQAINQERVTIGMSRLAIGEHLAKVRSILKPKRIYGRYLRSQFRLSTASADRWIQIYEETKDDVPEIVLRTAIAKGYDVIDTEMVKRIPPPKTHDRHKIVQYLEKLDEARREEQRASLADHEYDYETLMREALNFAGLRYSRLPEDMRTRHRWRKQFISMFLAETGATEEISFAPLPVPESLRVIHGRPRTISAA
jgi:hypothetical protein